jgi:hypothetical protein
VSQDLLPKVDRGDFQEVFIDDLNWLAPDVKQSVTATDEGGRKVTARNIASYKGLRVWLCDQRPGSVLEAELDRLIAKTSTDRLVIFDGDKEQVWRWPVRRAKDGSVTSRLTSHRHKKGDADPKFAARLDIIRMPDDVVLDANAVLGKVREAFDTEAQNESKRASKLMANMYAAIERAYPAKVDPKVRDHEISVTLARILFLMFGDDTEMWQTDAFRNVVQHEVLPDGSNLAPVLNELFIFLDTANPDRVPTGFGGFKYVNGGIFEERIDLPALNKDFRTAILDACAVDWSGISPAIFGSMFQSVRDAETRRALGEHYTSEENILKTLDPLFLDELREELAAALARDTTQKKVNSLNRLWERLGDIRFLDPACGCGNFIIVAYRELRAIELQVMEALSDLRDKHQLSLDAKADLKVTLDHFYGIEIDEWPARIAETAMFMMDRQCDLRLQERFGQAPERLPIQREAKIVVGNALRRDWRQILKPGSNVIVAGNPPFLGHASRTDPQSQELRDLWGRDDIGRLDYATGWYAQALAFFGDHDGRWSFVSTNSVTQGEPVPTLFSMVFGSGWRIRFGHRTFPWTSEATKAAAVHCVIVGFDRNAAGPSEVFDYDQRGTLASRSVVPSLNAYLVPGPNVLVEQRRRPISDAVYPFGFGSRPNDGGAFLLDDGAHEEAMADPVARKFVRPFVGAREIVQGTHRWVLWLRDARQTDIASSPLLQERVALCRAHRLSSKRPATREWADRPHLFDFDSQPSVPFVAVPGVSSENRPYYLAARFDSGTIASNAAFTAVDPDGLLFALVSSSMFDAWQRTVGGRLKSDLRFSNTVVWSNFPVPTLDHDQRQEIIQAGLDLASARAQHPSKSLAALYIAGSMPHDVSQSHHTLDAAVDAAFGCATASTLSERQASLFERYVELLPRSAT